jgi:hypothetical protein
MSEGSLPLSPTSPEPPKDASYEAIYAELMSTERGRRFLTEYARRNRHNVQGRGTNGDIETAAGAGAGAEPSERTADSNNNTPRDQNVGRMDETPLPARNNALAAVLALSEEELIALFS